MEIEIDKLIELGWQLGAVSLIFLIGVVCFQVMRRSLERMLDRGVISQPIFLIVKNTIRWLLLPPCSRPVSGLPMF